MTEALVEMHDAGGRRRLALLPGVTGYAEFVGPRHEHRITLERLAAGSDRDARYALWIGMNPSTAMADEDDQTVRKEQHWTFEVLGLPRLVKCNVGSYRCTDPAGLGAPGVTPCHPSNLPVTAALAHGAARIILAMGNPPPVLLGPCRTLFRTLGAAGLRAECLGTTGAGWPRHPSRLGYGTLIVPFSL